MIGNFTNALGNLGNDSYQYPNDIKRCDQVIKIESKLIDPSNEKTFIPILLTLSAYMVNLLNNKNSGELLYTVYTNELKGFPKINENSLECIIFLRKRLARLEVCFNDSKIANNIYENYRKLFSCGKGNGMDDSNIYYIIK